MSEIAEFFPDLSRFSDAKVLCIGDVMLDRFIYGSVERISPEGPIPVLKIEREKTMLGGVGNVIANLAGLGVTPMLVTLLGDDDAGAAVKTHLEGIVEDTDGIVVDETRPTTIKSRFLATSQQLLRTDLEDTSRLRTDIRDALIERAMKLIPECDVIILSDYGKGVLGETVIRGIIDKAQQMQRPVIVDPKGTDYARYRGATLVTPNRKELSEASGINAKEDDEIRAAAFRIIHECGISAVLATRSQDGLSVIEADETPLHIPTEAQEVYDVSGAGDTVVATVAAAMAAGLDIRDAARLANVAGGIAVGKVGTAIVRTQELVDALRASSIPAVTARRGTTLSPIVSLEQAIEQVERWRARGFKIGFTNGCFDLIHPGHVSLLNQARAQCDRLIVALNTDDSIRRLKGPTRPVQDETARATVMGSMSAVDLIILFDEDTPIRQITGISPDVLIKGSDYRVETVVGADHVMSYGGRVFLADIEEGFSTTNTITKMNVG